MCVRACVCVVACSGVRVWDRACACLGLLIQRAKRMHRIVFSSVTSLAGFSIFFDIISQTARFSEKLMNMKCGFWFSLQLLSKKCLILRRIQRDIVINVKTFPRKVHVILARFEWNFNLTDRVLKASSNMKFLQNLSSRSRVVPWGQTDIWQSKQSLFAILQTRLKIAKIWKQKVWKTARKSNIERWTKGKKKKTIEVISHQEAEKCHFFMLFEDVR